MRRVLSFLLIVVLQAPLGVVWVKAVSSTVSHHCACQGECRCAQAGEGHGMCRLKGSRARTGPFLKACPPLEPAAHAAIWLLPETPALPSAEGIRTVFSAPRDDAATQTDAVDPPPPERL